MMKTNNRRSHVYYRAAQWCALGAVVMLATIGPASLSLSRATSAANHSVTQQCQLNQPKAIAVDRLGIYIADSGSGRILFCARTGQCRVLLEGLRRPCGLAVDTLGNLYIAETGRDRILRRTPDGSISIWVVGFLREPTGLDVDGNFNLYIADTGNNRIWRRSLRGEVCPVSTERFSLNRPMGVAVSPLGILYIADTGNNRILSRSATCDPGILRPVPTDPFSLNQPTGLAIDGGNLYVTDTCNNRILVVDLIPGTVMPVAGSGPSGCGNGGFGGDGGPARQAWLNAPMDVAVDLAGNLLIADTDNHRIRQVATDEIITTLLCP